MTLLQLIVTELVINSVDHQLLTLFIPVSLADNLFEGTLPSAEMADMSELAGK